MSPEATEKEIHVILRAFDVDVLQAKDLGVVVLQKLCQFLEGACGIADFNVRHDKAKEGEIGCYDFIISNALSSLLFSFFCEEGYKREFRVPFG